MTNRAVSLRWRDDSGNLFIASAIAALHLKKSKISNDSMRFFTRHYEERGTND